MVQAEDTQDIIPAEEAESNTDDLEEEVVVVIDDEESPTSEEGNEVIKDIRKAHRDQVKKNRELKKQLEALTAPKDVDTLGEKPVFRDYDHDEEKFEKDLEEWHERKRTISKKAAELEEEQTRQASDWQTVLDGHEEKKAKLKVKNFEEIEGLVIDSLSQIQQAVIVKVALDSAKVVLALGTNPKKLQEISKIKDPVEFAGTVARLETKMNVTTRKASTSPERKVKGNASASAAVDSTLEGLQADAAKTGDRTKVAAYIRQKRKSS